MLTQGLATKGMYPGGTVGIASSGYSTRVLFIIVTPEEVYYPSRSGGGGIVKAGFRRKVEDNSYIVLQDENDIITIIMVGLGSGIIH